MAELRYFLEGWSPKCEKWIYLTNSDTDSLGDANSNAERLNIDAAKQGLTEQFRVVDRRPTEPEAIGEEYAPTKVEAFYLEAKNSSGGWSQLHHEPYATLRPAKSQLESYRRNNPTGEFRIRKAVTEIVEQTAPKPVYEKLVVIIDAKDFPADLQKKAEFVIKVGLADSNAVTWKHPAPTNLVGQAQDLMYLSKMLVTHLAATRRKCKEGQQ